MTNYLTMPELQSYAPSIFATAAHESRSDRYTYLPTSEIVAGLMHQGFQPTWARECKVRTADRKSHCKHMIRFRQSGVSGESVPEVVLVNSHDGSSSYKLYAGIFRLVCANGMVVADTLCDALTVPHKGDVLGNVIEGTFRIANQADKTLDTIREWRGLELTSGERMAFAAAAHQLRFADAEGQVTTPITPTQMLRPRRSADTSPDLYTTLNVVQENAIRGGLRGVSRQNGRRRAVTTRAVTGIDQDVKLNRALWTLAEEMRKLKTV